MAEESAHDAAVGATPNLQIADALAKVEVGVVVGDLTAWSSIVFSTNPETWDNSTQLEGMAAQVLLPAILKWATDQGGLAGLSTEWVCRRGRTGYVYWRS